MNYFAKKGRHGDTKIRNINNAPSHVNSNEASLLDLLGKRGEDIIRMVGAGTVNPDTGMRQYHAVGEELDDEGNVITQGSDHSDNQWDTTGYHRHFSGHRSTAYPGYGNEDNPLTDGIEGPSQHQYGGFTIDDFDKFMGMFDDGSMKEYSKEQFGVSGEKFDKFVTDPSVELSKLEDVESLFGRKKDMLMTQVSDAKTKLSTTLGRTGLAASGTADIAQEQISENYFNTMSDEIVKHRQDIRGIKEDIIGGYYTQMGQLT